jgi:hypothetical protein
VGADHDVGFNEGGLVGIEGGVVVGCRHQSGCGFCFLGGP